MQQFVPRTHKRMLVGFIAVAFAISLMVPSLAFADPSTSEKQAEAQSVLASLNGMQEKLDAASNNEFAALEEQATAEASRDEAQARIDEANGQIADLQDHLGVRARSMYRSGSNTFLDLLLGATTFDQFATNWDILNNLNEKDADLVQQTKDLRSEVEEQKAVYDEQQRVAAEKAAEATRIKEEAASTVATMQATYDGLSAEIAELVETERAAQQAAEAANAQNVIDAAVQPTENPDDDSSYTPPANNGPSYNPVTGNAVVDRAYGCLGLPYDYAAVGPNSFDCSGLVSYAITGSFSRLGNTYTFLGYPHVQGEPQPGDIAVNEGHCGIYIGGGQMIHAATYGVGVITGPVQGGMVFVRP